MTIVSCTSCCQWGGLYILGKADVFLWSRAAWPCSPLPEEKPHALCKRALWSFWRPNLTMLKSILLVNLVNQSYVFCGVFFTPFVFLDEKNRLGTWSWGGGYPKWHLIRATSSSVCQLFDHYWHRRGSPSYVRLSLWVTLTVLVIWMSNMGLKSTIHLEKGRNKDSRL